MAAKFDVGENEHPVVAVKRTMVSDYAGKSLNSNDDSQLILNPPHPRTRELQKWYSHLEDPQSLEHVTNSSEGNRDVNVEVAKYHEDLDHEKNKPFLKQRFLFGEIIEGRRPDESYEEYSKKFFYVTGFISFLKNDDKTFYLACPEEACRKKVSEESVGWRCENCNKTFDSCVPTYVVTAKISDVSDQCYVNFYRHEGTSMMGITAEKLKEIKDQGDI